MTLVGLDLNASRARAVQGPLGAYPSPVPLAEGGGDYSVALSLENRQVEVGRAGDRLRRRAPHLLCDGFMPVLGETRRWKAGRHDLDALQAMELFWRSLARPLGAGRELVVALPGYLNRWQADQVRRLGEKGGLQPLGSLPGPLAAALAAYAERHWSSNVVIVDLDDHALGISRVENRDNQGYLGAVHFLPQLGWRVWREKMLNALADCCVLQTRRDPRDNPEAEQALYEQIGPVLDAWAQGKPTALAANAGSWFQNVVITPEETLAFTSRLVQQAVREMQRFLAAIKQHPQAVILTHEAARLPGLKKGLAQILEGSTTPVSTANRAPSEDDFGINLLRDSGEDRCPLIPLGPAALASAAHGLVGCFQMKDLPRSHLEQSAPLPLPWPAEIPSAVLSYQGRTFHLNGSTFILGTQQGCQLQVDPARHPEVAARHCEIYLDHGTFVLFNRHPRGTWVNGCHVQTTCLLHAGDLIRLTLAGPEITFLGQPRRVLA